MTLFPGTVGANFPALGSWLGAVNVRVQEQPSGAGPAPVPALLAGGSALGSGLALGCHCWQEAPGGTRVSRSQTATHFPSSLSHC